jgi:hypothetical protein
MTAADPETLAAGKVTAGADGVGRPASGSGTAPKPLWTVPLTLPLPLVAIPGVPARKTSADETAPLPPTRTAWGWAESTATAPPPVTATWPLPVTDNAPFPEGSVSRSAERAGTEGRVRSSSHSIPDRNGRESFRMGFLGAVRASDFNHDGRRGENSEDIGVTLQERIGGARVEANYLSATRERFARVLRVVF